MANIFRISIYLKLENWFFARNFFKSKFQGLGGVAIDSTAEKTYVMIYFIPIFGLDKEKIDIFQIFKFVFQVAFLPLFFVKLKSFYPYNLFIQGRKILRILILEKYF